MMKENDWILANINNPDFSVKDFKIAGLDASNTQLLPLSEYKKSDTIVKAFTDESGKFNETALDEFYKQKQQEFLELNTDSALNELDYSMWDTRSVNKSVKDPEFKLIDVPNRYRQSIGIEARNTVSDPEFSDRELAQQSKIWNTKEQRYMDETPNDRTLFSNPLNYLENLFGDPLVLATYDENETDDKGNIIHRKGETKLNEEGLPYYETLNGRSIVGKDVLSSLDIITKDDSVINKYDFFDADGLDKSVAGTIVKNVAAVAPLFFLGPHGALLYGGYFVAKELAKAAPMMYEVLTMFGDSHEDNATLNTIAAYGHKLSGSTSDYSRNNMFSFENFGNLISDVALQWQQQMFVAKAISKLKGGEKEILKQAMLKAQDDYINQVQRAVNNVHAGTMSAKEAVEYMGTSSKVGLTDLLKTGKWQETILGKAAINQHKKVAQDVLEKQAKLGRAMSLAYMSMISNTDLYQDLVDKGASKSQAAAMALGSMIGMYGVNKLTGIGEAMFDASDAVTRRGIKDFISKNTNKMVESLTKSAKNPEELLKTIKKGSKFGEQLTKYQRALKDHTLTGSQKILTEAIEETSEEIITDISRQLGEIAHNFGYVDTGELGAWENALARYTMSFLGGAIGGGVFYGKEVWQNRGKVANKVDEQTLIWAARNNKMHLFEEAVDKMTKRGEYGSQNLSYDYQTGTIVTADANHKSINEQIGNELKSALQSFKTIVEENQLNVTDDQLYDRMVLSDVRLKRLQDYIGNGAFLTDFHQRFQDLTKDIIDLDQKLEKLSDEDRQKGKADSLIKRKQEKIKERDAILNGEYSRDYTDMMLFALDSRLSGSYVSTDVQSYVKNNHNQNYNRLTDSEKATYDKEYANYVKTKQKEDIKNAFEIYVEDRRKLDPKIPTLNQLRVEEWESVVNIFKNLNYDDLNIDYDTKLEEESDEEYQVRNTIKEGETEEQFNTRRYIRNKKIQELAQQKKIEFYQNVMNKVGIIDPNTYRLLMGDIGFTQEQFNKKKIYDISKQFSANKNNQKAIEAIIQKYKDSKDVHKAYEAIMEIYYESLLKTTGYLYNPNNSLQIVTEKKDEAGKPVYDDSGNVALDYVTKDVISLEELLTSYEREYTLSNNGDVDMEYVATVDGTLHKAIQEAWDKYLKSGLSISDFIKSLDEDDPIIREIVNKKTAISRMRDEALQSEKLGESLKLLEETLPKQLADYYNESWNEIFNTLKHKLNTEANPILNLLSILGETNLEKNVQEIFEYYSSLDNINDFELTDTQLQHLEEASKVLDRYQALLYGASSQPSFATPIGHNRTINEFVKNHPEAGNNWEPLMELKDPVTNIFNFSIDSYRRELNMWRAMHDSNASNKVKEHVLTDQALINTRLDFIKNNKAAFKLNDGTDLLEGVTLDTNDFKTLIDANVQIRKNFLNSKKDISELLNEVMPKLVKADLIPQQIQSEVKSDLEYSKLTEYDKFVLFVSMLASNNAKFIQKMLENSDPSIVPLAAQEYAQYVLNVIEEDVDMVNAALDYIKGTSNADTPVLWNTAILTGGAGSGKTNAVLKQHLRNYNQEELIISGPTDQQIDNLQNIFTKAKRYKIEEIIEQILGAQVKNSIDAAIHNGTTSEYLSTKKLAEGKTLKLNEKGITYHDINDIKAIVIDEATQVNSVYLQVLANWAKQHNKRIYLAGDENQNGFSSKNSPVLSIDREYTIAWRAPRIGITLRDTNIQKARNIKPLENVITELRNSTEGVDQADIYAKVLGEINNFNLQYYLQDGLLQGEYVTNELKDDLIKTLKGKIGFIGNSDSDNYKKLVDAGLDVTVLSPEQVQGREYTYTVVDIDWKDYNPKKSSVDSLRFLQQLYTMITRSQEGTILIDNGLTDIIKGNKENQTTGRAKPILSAKSLFDQKKQEQVKSLGNIDELLDTDEESITEPPVKPEKTTEESEPTVDSFEQEPYDLEHPIRVYSNVSLLGVNSEKDGDQIVWYNDDDLREDVGIFLRPGEKVVNADRKDQLVRNLKQLKALFEYGEDFFFYDKANKDIQELFTKEALQNAKYYIRVSDEGRLVGLTGLDQDKLKINNKVVTLVVKVLDKEGNENTFTLGGLGNPVTWDNNYDSIMESLEKRLIEASPEEYTKLSQYKANLRKNIDAYKSYIDSITKSNTEIEVEKPQFTGMTNVITKNPDGTDINLRLENIDNDYSPFDNATQYIVKSPIYVGTATEETLNKIKPGYGTIFVSGNPFLTPDQLIIRYNEQKESTDAKLWVRALPLDNLGVSFESLFSSNYKELYNIVKGKGKITFPAKLEPLGARMYISLWNYRADLAKFNNALSQWKTRESLSEEQVQNLIEEDYKAYQEMFKDKIKDLSEEEKRSFHLTEAEFRKNYNGTADLSKLWEFNDSLANSVRMFRLGYGAENGLYNRYLTNIASDNKFYQDSTQPVGIYIQPDVAKYQQDILNSLFDNIISKFVPTISDDTKSWINWKDKPANWVSKLKANGVLTITLEEENDEGKIMSHTIEHKLENGSDSLAALPLVLVKLFKQIQAYRNLGRIKNLNLDSVKKSIEVNGETLDFSEMIRLLPGGNLLAPIEVDANSKPQYQGVKIEKQKDGTYRQVDRRLENLMNFAFHGFVSQKHFNNFEGDELRATAAYFKHGILSDPILLEQAPTALDSKYAYSATSRKLYKSRAIVGGTIININLKPKESIKNSEPVNNPAVEEQVERTNTELINKLQGIYKLSKAALNRLKDRDDIINAYKSAIKNNVSSTLAKIDKSNDLLNLVIDIIIDDSNNVKIIKFSDKLSEKTEKSVKTMQRNSSHSLTLVVGEKDKFNVTLLPDGSFDIVELQVEANLENMKEEPENTNSEVLKTAKKAYNQDYLINTILQEAIGKLDETTKADYSNNLDQEWENIVIDHIKSKIIKDIDTVYTYDTFNEYISKLQMYLTEEGLDVLASNLKTIDCK